MKLYQALRTSLLFQSQFTYVPPSCFQISRKPNPVLAVTLTGGPQPILLNLMLFQNMVPKTTENFRLLFLGKAQHAGTGIHRHIQRAFLELGHLPNGNHSIYGRTFRDQSFQLLHERPGLLTSISQENTNDSRFAITLAPCPSMDYKNVVFGQVMLESMKNLKLIQRMKNKALLKISAVQELQRISTNLQSAH